MSDVIEPAGFRPPPQRVPVRADQRHITLMCPECSKRGVHLDVWTVFRSAKLWCRACRAVTYYVTWDIVDDERAIVACLSWADWPGDPEAENPWYEERR
jgi:hypothetical protein